MSERSDARQSDRLAGRRWAMREWLNSFDVRIDLGPGPFVVAGGLALATAIGTVSGHALRVARTSPIVALRYE
jgi:putative ABC transport system permease protein